MPIRGDLPSGSIGRPVARVGVWWWRRSTPSSMLEEHETKHEEMQETKNKHQGKRNPSARVYTLSGTTVYIEWNKRNPTRSVREG